MYIDKLLFFIYIYNVNKNKRGKTMAKHYFTINEYELMKEMNEGYYIKMEGLGPFGEKRGSVESFDLSDAIFDPSDILDSAEDDLSEEQKDELSETDELSIYSVKDYIPDIEDSWDLGQIVVFDCEIGQTRQNFLQWDRCIGDIYCDEDDYYQFISEHEEYQTKEYHIAKIKKLMEEHDISIEDLK